MSLLLKTFKMVLV